MKRLRSRRLLVVLAMLVALVLVGRWLDRSQPIESYRVIDDRTIAVEVDTSSPQWTRVTGVSETWDKVVVHQFSENGSDSTALTYGQQENEALISSIGWQVTGNWSGWRPFARATWEYNFKNDERQVSATPVGLNGAYFVPVSKPDENYALFDLGVSKDFGGVTGYIAGNASAGKSNGDFWAVTVGIRMPI